MMDFEVAMMYRARAQGSESAMRWVEDLERREACDHAYDQVRDGWDRLVCSKCGDTWGPKVQ